MSILQILSNTTDALKIVVDANATTNESRVVVNFAQQTSTAPHTPDRQISTTNGTTAVTIVTAPGGASIERSIANIIIWNRDTVDHTYTIYLDVSGTAYNIYTAQSVKAGKSTILAVSGGGGSSGGGVSGPASSTTRAIATYADTTGAALLDNPNNTVDASGNVSNISEKLTGTGGNGFLEIVAQSSDPSAPGAAGWRLFADASGYLAWIPKVSSDTFKRLWNGVLTAARTWTWPDKSGTVALTQDLPSAGGSIVKNPGPAVWNRGTSTIPDPYVLTGASATVAREATIVKVGLYSLKLTRSGTDCTATQDLYVPAGSTYVRGRTYIFGAWVYATVASRARLVIDDGVTQTYSTYHSGGSAWEFLTVSATIDNAATVFNTGLQVATGNTSAYINALVIAEGNALYTAYYPEHRPFNEFPQRATIWMDEVTYITGGGKTLNAGGANYPYAYITPTIAANGDVFTASFWIKAGTYTMAVLGATYLNHPILDWTIDAVAAITGQDWYSGGAVYNVVKTGTVTVVGDGYHVLKCTVNGKNASSTNYLYELTKVYFYPSAD